MAISDLIPNIFGSTPEAYRGLLTSEQSTGLEKRANLGGLLGFAGALAQGMSPQGYRRSALQNILSAAGAGFGAAGQTYESGIGQLSTLQKLQQSQAQIEAMNQLLSNPSIDPQIKALIRVDPAAGIKYLVENVPLQQAIRGDSTNQPAPSAAATPSTPSPVPAGSLYESYDYDPISTEILKSQLAGGKPTTPAPADSGQLAPVTVQPKADPIRSQIDRLLSQNDRLSIVPGEGAQKKIDTNIKQIDSLRKQLDRRSVEEFDFKSVEDIVPPQFKGRVASLRDAAKEGSLSMNDLMIGIRDIEKGAIEFVTKQQDYTNQDRRVAAGMFQGRAIESLNPVELMQLENKLFDLGIRKARAGATTINMPSESERTAGYLTTRLKNSLAQLQTAVGETPTAASPNFRAELVKYVTKSDYLKNLANPEARQRVEAAELDILDAALTLATGAAYTREQLESTRSTYFPALGDKPANIRDKAIRLDKLLKDAAMTKAGRSAPALDGANSAFDMDAINQELERRKKGK